MWSFAPPIPSAARAVFAAALVAATANIAEAIEVATRGGRQGVESPGYQDSVACSRKVSALASETRRLLDQNQDLERRCQRQLAYYRRMIKLRRRSKHSYKRMHQTHAKSSKQELRAEYMQQYESTMCMKTFWAFVHGKKKKDRLDVLHVCIGRKPLDGNSLLLQDSKVNQSYFFEDFDTQGCPQAESMEARNRQLRAAKKAKRHQCLAKKAKLKAKLDKLSGEEDAHRESLHTSVEEKNRIKAQAADDVEQKFCKVIMAHYGTPSEEKEINKLWSCECQDSPPDNVDCNAYN